jgi:4-hydroxy 2-oxovalerate aldolase
MPAPIDIDRLTGTLGYAGVPASFLLHAVRAGERFSVDPRQIIVELGRRKAVVGQEDMIIDVAAGLAAGLRA